MVLAFIQGISSDHVQDNVPFLLFQNKESTGDKITKAFSSMDAMKIENALDDSFFHRFDCTKSMLIIYDLPFLSREGVVASKYQGFMSRVQRDAQASSMYLYTMGMRSNNETVSEMGNVLTNMCGNETQEQITLYTLDEVNSLFSKDGTWKRASLVVVHPSSEVDAIAMYDTIREFIQQAESDHIFYTTVTTTMPQHRKVMDAYTKMSFKGDSVEEEEPSEGDEEHFFDKYSIMNDAMYTMLIVLALLVAPILGGIHMLISIQTPEILTKQ